MPLKSIYQTLSPLAHLLNWSQAICSSIKGNVPHLLRINICQLTFIKHIYHIMKLTEQCASKPPTQASLSYSSDHWPHVITETLTTYATYWLTSQEPIGKRSEPISQDPNKYVKLYTTQHLFITSSVNYRHHPTAVTTKFIVFRYYDSWPPVI